MKAEKAYVTERGFQRIEFRDLYDCACSLQQSSLAVYEEPGTGAIWLGCDEGGRMHLAETDVERLIELLQNWLDSGNLFSEER